MRECASAQTTTRRRPRGAGSLAFRARDFFVRRGGSYLLPVRRSARARRPSTRRRRPGRDSVGIDRARRARLAGAGHAIASGGSRHRAAQHEARRSRAQRRMQRRTSPAGAIPGFPRARGPGRRRGRQGGRSRVRREAEVPGSGHGQLGGREQRRLLRGRGRAELDLVVLLPQGQRVLLRGGRGVRGRTDFNLSALSSMVPYYDYALDLILDVEYPQRRHAHRAAARARRVRGRDALRPHPPRPHHSPPAAWSPCEKYKQSPLRQVPRVAATTTPCLPVGTGDVPPHRHGEDLLPEVRGHLLPRSKYQGNIGGAYSPAPPSRTSSS